MAAAEWMDVDNPNIYDFCKTLEVRRDLKHSRGLVLYFPRVGIVGAVFDLSRTGAFVQVIHGNHGYEPSGAHLFVLAIEIDTAIEVPIRIPQ